MYGQKQPFPPMENSPAPPSPSPLPPENGPVVMLAVFAPDGLSEADLRNGIQGYLLRSIDPQEVMSAITEIGKGGIPLGGAVKQQVVVHFRKEGATSGPESPGLSPREKEVLHALVEGYSYKMIAHHLEISFETVRSHIKRIYEKLKVHNNTEAVAKALKIGLVA